MDFSLPNSESWDSKPSQDKFINEYFFKHSISDSKVSKPRKKKRKYSTCVDSQDPLLNNKDETCMLEQKDAGNKNKLLNKTKKLKKNAKQSSNEILSDPKINDTCSNSQFDQVKKRKKKIKNNKVLTEESSSKIEQLHSKFIKNGNQSNSLFSEIQCPNSDIKKSLRKNTIQNDLNKKELNTELSKSKCKINQMDLKISKMKKKKLDKLTSNDFEPGLSNEKQLKIDDFDNNTYFDEIDLGSDNLNKTVKDNLTNRNVKKSLKKNSFQIARTKNEAIESDTEEALRDEIKNSLVYQNLKQFRKIDTLKNENIKNQTSDKDNQNFPRSKDKTPLADTSSSLRNQAQKNLQAAKFRYLNQKLYTITGKEAFQYFQDNHEEFYDYHTGYQLQVSKWPINPIDFIIKDISKSKYKVIADMGCGEAKIAQTFPKKTVYSFDLVALNKYVQACDISEVNLPNESVDVVVFCLSLMGINLQDYLLEANRILKFKGLLKIAEVESRIDDLKIFIKKIEEFGFTLINTNVTHKLFVFLDFYKSEKSKKNTPNLSLKPCLYKKR